MHSIHNKKTNTHKKWKKKKTRLYNNYFNWDEISFYTCMIIITVKNTKTSLSFVLRIFCQFVYYHGVCSKNLMRVGDFFFYHEISFVSMVYTHWELLLLTLSCCCEWYSNAKILESSSVLRVSLTFNDVRMFLFSQKLMV